MDPGEQTTGTRDEHYNLVSVLYHALHGAENCDIYAIDAEAVGSIELSDFFREAQAMQRHLADEAKGLLGIGGAGTSTGDVPTGDAMSGGAMAGGAMAGGTMAGGAMLESEVPADTVPEDIPLEDDVPPDMMHAPPDDSALLEDTQPETPGGISQGTEDVPPPDVPRTEGIAPETEEIQPGTTPLERDIPPGTEPADIPPETDVQRQAQGQADEVGVANEGIPPTTDVPPTPPDAAAPGMALPPEEDVVVESTEPPVEEVPPRETDTLAEASPLPPGSPRMESDTMAREGPPNPGEPRLPSEEPLGPERGTGGNEYFSDVIRETGRRSRGEF